MRIVHICLNDLFMDGWLYQDNCLSKAHAKLGHQVTIITSHWYWNDNCVVTYDKRDTYFNNDGVKIVRLKMKGLESFSRKFRKFEGLEFAIEQENPDFLFIHSVNFTDVTILVDYLKLHPNVKAVADNHGDFSNSARNWLSKCVLHGIIWRHYAQLLIPYVEKFYGVLPARVDFLQNVYKIPKERTELLVMGADDELVERALNPEITKKIRKKNGIGKDDFLIMTGGKIDLAKQQTITLMKVVNRIANPSVKLIVFGSVVEELRTQVEELCGEYCSYIGWVDGKETLNYYAASDLVIFPGRHSVFWEQVVGLGKPMVCKYWEGTTHVDVGGNVKFLYKDTEEELYQVLNTLIANKDEFEKMRQVAKEQGMKTFSYLEIAKKSLEYA